MFLQLYMLEILLPDITLYYNPNDRAMSDEDKELFLDRLFTNDW